ncbi:hypothetical protein Q7P37_007428 [Cladosporium fusiforme]
MYHVVDQCSGHGSAEVIVYVTNGTNGHRTRVAVAARDTGALVWEAGSRSKLVSLLSFDHRNRKLGAVWGRLADLRNGSSIISTQDSPPPPQPPPPSSPPPIVAALRLLDIVAAVTAIPTIPPLLLSGIRKRHTSPTVAGHKSLRQLHQGDPEHSYHAIHERDDPRDGHAADPRTTGRLPTITDLANTASFPQEGDNNAYLRKSTDLNAGGIFMVQSFDMPAATAAAGGDADAGRRVPHSGGGNANGVNGGKKYGAEEVPTPAVDALPGGWPKTPSGLVNGDVKEGFGGKDGSALSVPNGFSPQERTASAKSIALSTRSRKSSQLDDGKKSGETMKEAAPRLGVAEEGYFQQQPIPNGKPAASVKTSVAKPMHASNGDVPGNSTAQRLGVSMSPITPNSALAPVEESSHAQPSSNSGPDGRLRIPGSGVHRASSPPAFHPPGSPMSNASQVSSTPARPDGLRQRHTLEVPKLATSRTSRDSSEHPVTSTDGVVTSTGRFSPNTPTKRRGSLQLARRVTRSIHSDMHLDDVPQDEDVTRWTEHIKAKRASKKARVDTDDDRVVVGTKVDEHHVNWVTAYNMLTGIRFTVSRTNAKLDRELTDADFGAKHKFSFDITGNELTPSAKYDFKFKDYAPWVFRDLRAKFRLDPAEYLMSLTSKYILSELGSPGKSGSFFYFSRDYKYIIKTIHHGEHKFLRKILKQYYNHVCENPNTLLSQFYGLHRVKIPYGRKIHFVVMNNLFPPHRDIHRTFDLKGSTIGRDFKEEDLEKNPRATLKDLNWLRRNLHLEFGPTKKEAFVTQMQRDVALLQKLKIMDYSMLVGIHDLGRGNEEQLRDKTLKVFQPGGDSPEEQNLPAMGALARTPSKLETAKRAKELREMVKKEKPVPMDQMLDKMPEGAHRKDFYFYADDGGFQATHENESPGEEIYYLGIIDCLTRYTFLKKAEHFWKGMGGNESQISPIPPERYGDRFVKFISGMTMSRERAEHDRLSKTLEAATGLILPPGIQPPINDPHLGGCNLHEDRTDPPGTERVIEKAERSAEKTVRRGADEQNIPDRSLGAVGRQDSDGAVLPVIGEAVESSSQVSRTPPDATPKSSRDDVRRQRRAQAPPPVLGNANMTTETIGEVPPPTPPKPNGTFEEREGRPSWGGGPPPTPPKDEKYKGRLSDDISQRGRLSVESRDKELPSLPPAANMKLSASPARAERDDLAELRQRFG